MIINVNPDVPKWMMYLSRIVFVLLIVFVIILLGYLIFALMANKLL